MDAITVLSYSIAAFVPILSLIVMCAFMKSRAKQIFTPEEFELWFTNQEID
jgi:hypothetical protein